MRYIVYVLWHIPWPLIGQLGSVHVALLFVCFFVRYCLNEGPVCASCMSNPCLCIALRISLVTFSLKCGNFKKHVLEIPCVFLFLFFCVWVLCGVG